jgi:hypothetical protein
VGWRTEAGGMEDGGYRGLEGRRDGEMEAKKSYRNSSHCPSPPKIPKVPQIPISERRTKQ